MPLEPGQLVTPQVRLVRQLKAGGMGSVWVADQLGLKTQVAVKFIQGNHAHKPELAARFAREAMAAASIKSPHVVQIHDHGVTDAGDPYMVMELLEGEDLATRIRRDGPMRLEDIARVVQQVCRVLLKAHALGIVHRDIKPSNIFVVQGEGEGDHEIFVKILDFGVAKVKQDEESDLTGTGVMMGTMVYMSPEQLLDARNVDFHADLWSLAVSTYYAIAGSRPFSDDNGVGALVLALDRGQYEPITKMRAGLPPALDDWFTRGFKRKPEERFGSAKEMANELLAAIGSKETLAMLQASSTALSRVSTASLPEIILPPPARAGAVARKRRSPVPLFLAGVAAAVAVAGMVVFSLSQSARSDAAPPPPTASAETPATAVPEPTPSATASAAESAAPTAEEPATTEPTAAPSAANSAAPSGHGPLHGPRPKSTSEKDYGF